jgi:hypothetical protein
MGQKHKRQVEAESRESTAEVDDDHAEIADAVDLGRGLKGRVMLVTPKIAVRWLTRLHQEQRNVASGRVAALARDILNDSFVLTHQAVAFDGEGHLIDGQHRLRGICEANKGVHMLVVWNNAAKFKDPIDRNLPRSLGFIAQRTNREVAALACLRDLEAGYEIKSSMTVNDTVDLWDKHGSTLDLVRAGTPNGKGVVGGMLAAYVWAYPVNPPKVCEFATKVANGEMIQRGDAPYALRRWRESQASYSIPSWKTAMATFGCLRAFIDDEQMATVHPDAITGYRTITGKRRALKVPNTPSVDIVPSRG